MKKLIASVTVVFALALGGNAYAGCTSNTISGTTFYNFNNGVGGTSNNIGGTTFHNFNNL